MTFDSGVYKTVNYKEIYTIVNEYLATSSTITDFPFKVKNFVHTQADIQFFSYKKAIEKYGFNPHYFGSESAVWTEMNGANIIFFNQDEPPHRIRFSIIHEFAHYNLKHKTNLSSSDPLYQCQELEANCFAAQLLMPEQLLRECVNRHQKINAQFIMDAFSVSNEAAEKRLHTLAKTEYAWRSRAEKMYDDIILMKYEEKLNAIAPKPDPYSYFNFEDEYERQRERDSWY